MASSAIPNSGFEAAASECVLPGTLARRLGLWPKLPPGGAMKAYRTVGGRKVKVGWLPEGLHVEVAAEGAAERAVACTAVISPGEDEVVLNDLVMGELGVVLVDTAKGLWILRGESLEAPRPSVPPQKW